MLTVTARNIIVFIECGVSVDAAGANILWGYEPDKFYHSCLVYGKTSRKIGALVKGEPVYVRVDTFNEVLGDFNVGKFGIY